MTNTLQTQGNYTTEYKRGVHHRRDHWTQGQWKPVLEEVHGLNREQHWRKGDHWKALIRKHAQLAVDDCQLVDALSIDCRDCHVRAFSLQNHR